MPHQAVAAGQTEAYMPRGNWKVDGCYYDRSPSTRPIARFEQKPKVQVYNIYVGFNKIRQGLSR